MRAVWAMVLCACGRFGFDPHTGLTDDGALGDDSGVGTQPVVSNLMFVTSTTVVPGALGGTAGADAECNARAVHAGLTGTFVAYLSTASQGGADRLAGSRGWTRIDGRPVVDTVADLENLDLLYSPVLDESGARVANDTFVVTGTDASGKLIDSCADWTSTALSVTMGQVGWTDASWVAGYTNGCSLAARLYCFGVGGTSSVAPPAIPGRKAFLAATFVPVANGSRLDADNLCNQQATTNGITGTFLALLPTSSTSAISRFDTAGPTWYRLDGVALASSAAAFATGDLLAPSNMYADRTRIAQDFYAWTGDILPNVVGSSAGTCKDWGSATSANSGGIGLPAVFGAAQYVSSTQGCSAANALYCLEQ